MNAKTAKLLRKKAKMFNFDYTEVKNAFQKLSKEQQDAFLKKWINYG